MERVWYQHYEQGVPSSLTYPDQDTERSADRQCPRASAPHRDELRAEVCGRWQDRHRRADHL